MRVLKLAVPWTILACSGCTQVLDFDSTSGGKGPFRCSEVEPAPWFCDDFDGEAAGLDAWQGSAEEQGTLTVDASLALSPPRSLAAVSKSSPSLADANVSVYAQLDLDEFEQQPLALFVSFDVLIHAIDRSADSWATVFKFAYAPELNGTYLAIDAVPDASLHLEAGEWALDAAGASVSESPHGQVTHSTLDLDSWHHIELRVLVSQPEGANNSFSVSADNGLPIEGSFATALQGGRPLLWFGVNEVSPTTSDSWDVRYDNVLVQVNTSQ